MKNETKSEKIVIRLEPSLKERFIKIAEKEKRAMSNLAYLVLLDYVERSEKDN